MIVESLANVCVVRVCQLSRDTVSCNRFVIVELFLMSCKVTDSLQQVAACLEQLQSSDVALDNLGACPGFVGESGNVHVVHAQPSAHVSSSAAISVYCFLPPSESEMMEALSLSSRLNYSDSSECFRLLVFQNSVILREALHRRALQVQATQYSSSGTHTSSSAMSSSTVSSGVGSPSDTGAVAGSSNGADVSLSKPSPSKTFQCPVCLRVMTEKEFDRHIKTWIVKCQRPLSKKHTCSGIRDNNHPLLQHFPQGLLPDRVRWLVSDITGLVRPGAYDCLQPGGSGRHLIVAQRFAQLMNPVMPDKH